jgi:hypothetical protein
MGKFEILLDKARIEVGILKDNGFSTGNIERAMDEWLRQSQETPTEGFTKVEDKFIDWYQVEIHSGRIPYAISIIEKFRQLREEGNANPLDAQVSQPSEPSFGQWTLTKDRMPLHSGFYLTVDINENDEPFIMIYPYDEIDKTFVDMAQYPNKDVIKWMPLPKP